MTRNSRSRMLPRGARQRDVANPVPLRELTVTGRLRNLMIPETKNEDSESQKDKRKYRGDPSLEKFEFLTLSH